MSFAAELRGDISPLYNVVREFEGSINFKSNTLELTGDVELEAVQSSEPCKFCGATGNVEAIAVSVLSLSTYSGLIPEGPTWNLHTPKLKKALCDGLNVCATHLPQLADEMKAGVDALYNEPL